MNQEVMKELQNRVNDYMEAKFAEFKKQMVSSVKPSDDICKNHECLNDVRLIMNETVKSLSFLARGHGINSNDFVEAVLKISVDGNEYCRKLEKTAEAFKDDKDVGFC